MLFTVHNYVMFILFYSLFIWSNETINIWSHILGFFLFFYLMIWDNITGIAQAKGTIVDHVVLSLALICFQVLRLLYVLSSYCTINACSYISLCLF